MINLAGTNTNILRVYGGYAASIFDDIVITRYLPIWCNSLHRLSYFHARAFPAETSIVDRIKQKKFCLYASAEIDCKIKPAAKYYEGVGILTNF